MRPRGVLLGVTVALLQAGGCQDLLGGDPLASCSSFSDGPGRRTYMCPTSVVSVVDRAGVTAEAALEQHLASFGEAATRNLVVHRIERGTRKVAGRDRLSATVHASSPPGQVAPVPGAPAGAPLAPVKVEIVALPLDSGEGARLVACAGPRSSLGSRCGRRLEKLAADGPAAAKAPHRP